MQKAPSCSAETLHDIPYLIVFNIGSGLLLVQGLATVPFGLKVLSSNPEWSLLFEHELP